MKTNFSALELRCQWDCMETPEAACVPHPWCSNSSDCQHSHLPEPSVTTVCSAFEDTKTRQDAQVNPCSLPSVSFIVTLIILQGCSFPLQLHLLGSGGVGIVAYHGPRCLRESPTKYTHPIHPQVLRNLSVSLRLTHLHFIGFKSSKSC